METMTTRSLTHTPPVLVFINKVSFMDLFSLDT